MAESMVKGIIGISIGALMLANVFLFVVHNTSTTGWSAGEIALWGLLGLAGIVSLVYGTFAIFGLA